MDMQEKPRVYKNVWRKVCSVLRNSQQYKQQYKQEPPVRKDGMAGLQAGESNSFPVGL